MRSLHLRHAAGGIAALSLAGCAAGVAPPAARVSPPAAAAHTAPSVAAPAAGRGQRTAARLNLPGLEGVVGATAAGLVNSFGRPRLDIREGDARKLQFAGGACVLDVYLYPPARGGEPQADYVEARLWDGRDTDRAGCVAALRR